MIFIYFEQPGETRWCVGRVKKPDKNALNPCIYLLTLDLKDSGVFARFQVRKDRFFSFLCKGFLDLYPAQRRLWIGANDSASVQ